MVEFSRNASFNKTTPEDRCFLDVDKIYQNYLMFIASTTTKVSPKLYDYSVCKGPLEINVELVNVGKTSFGLKTTIGLEQQETPLCENFVQSVFVDLAKRTPSPPPLWWLEKYAKDLQNLNSPRLPRHMVPESGVLSTYQMKIAASDLDNYWHTNWSNYLKFSYNAFVDYETTGYSPSKIAKAFRRSKKFSLLYLKESNLNDVIDIHLWKDQQNENLFKFQFLKKEDVICESQLELYPQDSNE